MTANNIQFTPMEIQIIKYFFKHYKDRYNARQLARALGINHAHANKLCNLLASKHLLAGEDIGNAVYFSFDYNNKLAVNFVEYLISLEEMDFPKWLAVVLHCLKQFGPHIQIGAVFGSAIKRSDFNDVDVLLVYDKKESKNVNKIKKGIMKSQLLEKPLRYVDVSEKDILLNGEDKVFYNIFSENLVFHNAEKYVEMVKKCRR